MMEEKLLELGERRRVTLEVRLATGQVFRPANCCWELRAAGCVCSDPESEGAADAQEDGDGSCWLLTAVIQPEKRGIYRLQYSFDLGEEIIRRSVQIKVN